MEMSGRGYFVLGYDIKRGGRWCATGDELRELVAEVRRIDTELTAVEVKAANGGTPLRPVREAMSAFANRAGGGVILLGLDEERRFEIVGVGDAGRLQREIADLASSQYEVFSYRSAREQQAVDVEPVLDATVNDLDRVAIDAYLLHLRRLGARAVMSDASFLESLRQLRIIREVDGVPRPTLAALLAFGSYPQAVESQLMVTFVQYYGTDDTEPTPRGERFLDNRRFEGNVVEVIDGAVTHILGRIRRSSLIEGVFRRDSLSTPRRLFARQ